MEEEEQREAEMRARKAAFEKEERCSRGKALGLATTSMWILMAPQGAREAGRLAVPPIGGTGGKSGAAAAGNGYRAGSVAVALAW